MLIGSLGIIINFKCRGQYIYLDTFLKLYFYYNCYLKYYYRIFQMKWSMLYVLTRGITTCQQTHKHVCMRVHTHIHESYIFFLGLKRPLPADSFSWIKNRVIYSFYWFFHKNFCKVEKYKKHKIKISELKWELNCSWELQSFGNVKCSHFKWYSKAKTNKTFRNIILFLFYFAILPQRPSKFI